MTEPFRVPVAELTENPWNSNSFRSPQALSLVKELRKVGINTKPVVVRQAGNRLEIIDGEQTWRAAKEAGLDHVLTIRHDCDDFEAMRLSFRANLRGQNHAVRLGRMLKAMLADRPNLTNTELAEQLGCSEGTIRNRLIYAELADRARIDKSLPTEEEIAAMPVKQVRALLGEGEEKEAKQKKTGLQKLFEAFQKLNSEEQKVFLEKIAPDAFKSA